MTNLPLTRSELQTITNSTYKQETKCTSIEHLTRQVFIGSVAASRPPRSIEFWSPGGGGNSGAPVQKGDVPPVKSKRFCNGTTEGTCLLVWPAMLGSLEPTPWMERMLLRWRGERHYGQPWRWVVGLLQFGGDATRTMMSGSEHWSDLLKRHRRWKERGDTGAWTRITPLDFYNFYNYA
jgi:hypothetical protein